MAGSPDDRHVRTKEFITTWCPNTSAESIDWSTASDPSDRYNCMGFAVGVLAWWQPLVFSDGELLTPDHYWPKGAPQDEGGLVESYVEAATTEGFVICDGPDWEEGFEKISLYFKPDTEGRKLFTHAARHKTPGWWESKLGEYSDIVHEPDALDGCIWYGDGRIHMRRVFPRLSPPSGT